MTDLPAPLVPPDTDIIGLDGFLLDTERLMASELWALASGDEFKAAIGLWCRAWKQDPPGSLPNDERVLAAFSGAGARWRKVRDMAMRGFVLCSDGRLYHQVLCGDVLRAAKRKTERRERTRAATEARLRAQGANRDVARHVQRDVDENVERDGLPERGGEREGILDLGSANADPLSGSSPDGGRLNGKAAPAMRILEFLNLKATRNYRPTQVNLGYIAARLKEGYTEDDCRAVVALRVRDWGSDPKMAKYLRPSTLFNREKFNQYAGELVTHEVP